MGFIAYRLVKGEDGPAGVRIYLECHEETDPALPAGVHDAASPQISYSYAVDAQFAANQSGCSLSGVEDILALKKFYKFVFSLEERARERGGDWRDVFCSEESLIEHLGYTRNARLLSDEPRRRAASPELSEELPEAPPEALLNIPVAEKS